MGFTNGKAGLFKRENSILELKVQLPQSKQNIVNFKALNPILDITFEQNNHDLIKQKIMVLEPGTFRVGNFNDLSLDSHIEDKSGMKVYKTLSLKNKNKCFVTSTRKSLLIYSFEKCTILDKLNIKEDIKDFKYDEGRCLLYILIINNMEKEETRRDSTRKRQNSARNRKEDLKGITEVFSSRRSIANKTTIERVSKYSTPGRSRRSSNRIIEKLNPKYCINVYRIIEDESKFDENCIGSYPLSEEFEFTTFDLSPKCDILVASGYKKIFRSERISRYNSKSKRKMNSNDKLPPSKESYSKIETYSKRVKRYYNALFLFKVDQNGKLIYQSGRDILSEEYDNSGQINYVKLEEDQITGKTAIFTATNQGLNIFGFYIERQTFKMKMLFYHQCLSPGILSI